jgi:hypothetical protein
MRIFVFVPPGAVGQNAAATRDRDVDPANEAGVAEFLILILVVLAITALAIWIV